MRVGGPLLTREVDAPVARANPPIQESLTALGARRLVESAMGRGGSCPNRAGTDVCQRHAIQN